MQRVNSILAISLPLEIERCIMTDKEYSKERYEFYKSHGICVECGREPAYKGHTRCLECRFKSIERSKKLRQSMKILTRNIKENTRRSCASIGKKMVCVSNVVNLLLMDIHFVRSILRYGEQGKRTDVESKGHFLVL